MNIDPRKRYRIEFRSYNIGDGVVPEWAPRSGFAHNFIAVIEILPDGRQVPVGEIHGMSANRRSGSVHTFDIAGTGRLVALATGQNKETPRALSNPTESWGIPNSVEA